MAKSKQNYSFPTCASCASIDALSPFNIRSNSGGQMPVTNSRSSSGTPASTALSPATANRVRTSFSRRTLFSMYESNGFMAITYYFTVTISVVGPADYATKSDIIFLNSSRIVAHPSFSSLLSIRHVSDPIPRDRNSHPSNQAEELHPSS